MEILSKVVFAVNVKLDTKVMVYNVLISMNAFKTRTIATLMESVVILMVVTNVNVIMDTKVLVRVQSVVRTLTSAIPITSPPL